MNKKMSLFKKISTTIILSLMICSLYIQNCSAYSNPEKQFHSLQSIREISEFFLKNTFSEEFFEIKIEIGSLDNRLKLRKCDVTPDVFFANGNKKIGNNIIGVSCNSKPAWKIFIPVKITVIEEIVVAANSIRRGKIIEKKDLEIKEMEISKRNNNSANNIKDLIGKIALRNIYKGSVINSFNVGLPDLIKKGQVIYAEITKPGITVRVKARALSSGKKGELIKAKNSKTDRIIEGIIINESTIKIN